MSVMRPQLALALKLGEINGPTEGRLHPTVWAPSDQSEIGRCRTAGWKVLPVPRFFAAGLTSENAPSEPDWHHASAWLVIPPEGHPEPARQFGGERRATRWALEQIAHTQAAPPEPSGTE